MDRFVVKSKRRAEKTNGVASPKAKRLKQATIRDLGKVTSLRMVKCLGDELKDASEVDAVRVLKELKTYRMSEDIFKRTGVGLQVNACRKRFKSNSEVRLHARGLVEYWKSQVLDDRKRAKQKKSNGMFCTGNCIRDRMLEVLFKDLVEVGSGLSPKGKLKKVSDEEKLNFRVAVSSAAEKLESFFLDRYGPPNGPQYMVQGRAFRDRMKRARLREGGDHLKVQLQKFLEGSLDAGGYISAM